MHADWQGELVRGLQERRDKQAFRHRKFLQSACQPRIVIDGRPCVNFSSNDYLGLAADPRVVAAASDALKKFGCGSGASHLVCGHHELHHQLEQKLAEITGRESAILFGSGYQANTAILQSLLRSGDTVFQDKLNHASLLDGALQSDATLKRYKHADTDHLERLLTSDQSARKMIVSDAVFSMDGDIAPVERLCSIAKQHQAVLMLDDAHGFGVLGERGNGIVEHASLSQDAVPILMATLGKAAGVYGAFAAGSRELIETLVNSARSYIYSTAPPAHLAAATMASLDIIQHEPERREKLVSLVRHFKRGLQDMGIAPAVHDTPIQVLVAGGNDLAMRMAESLLDKGLYVAAIRPPTVPAKSARLRITFSAAHSSDDVDLLLQGIADTLAELEADQLEGLASSA